MAERLAPWVWVGAGALAGVAGIVNVVGFLGFQHQAITHLTGNTNPQIRLGVHFPGIGHAV